MLLSVCTRTLATVKSVLAQIITEPLSLVIQTTILKLGFVKYFLFCCIIYCIL